MNAMKRKLLVLPILLFAAGLGLQRPAGAAVIPTCSTSFCANNGSADCRCPMGSPAAGMITICVAWRGECWYV